MGVGGWPIRDFFESLSGWIAVAALLEFLFGRERLARYLAIALLFIPLRLFIAHRTMTFSETAGALVAIGLWFLVRNLAQPMLFAALVAIAGIMLAGLTPFHPAQIPQPFTWTPFLAMLGSSWQTAFIVLLRKSFLYGSAVWLWHRSGRGWIFSLLIVAIPLAIIEGVQIYLPNHVAEITDPLIALMMGLSLMLLEKHEARKT
jgi:hypothetical protein